MAKVYVVTAGEYSDYDIVKIFSTCEKAQEYIDIVSSLGDIVQEKFNDIQEWELDDFNISELYIQYCYKHSITNLDTVEVWDKDDKEMPSDNLLTYPSGNFCFFFSLPYSKRLANAPDKNNLLLKIARDRLAKYKAEAMEF